MPDTVDIFGLHMSKGAALAGGGALVVVGGYLVYKKLKKPKTTTPATGAGGAAYAYGYGAYAYGYGVHGAMYGYGFGTQAYGYGVYSPYGSAYGPYGPYGYGAYGSGISEVIPPPVTTNAQWAQAAEAQLAANGVDSNTALAAIGLYLAGGNLTANQASIVQEAIAVEGNPPVPGAAGYPPAVHYQTSTGQGGGGQQTTTVPNVVGKTAGQAHDALVAAQLVPIADPGQKATSRVRSTSPGAGKTVPLESPVLITT